MIKTHKKIAILGFAREGQALLRYLLKSPDYKNYEIAICDRKPVKSLFFTKGGKNKRVKIISGEKYLKNLEIFDVIFRSPGIPYMTKEIQEAAKSGTKITSSTELFLEQTKKIKCLTIGITGTKGKSTTSTLIYKILKAAKRDVYLAGNIGKPAIEILPRLSKKSIVVLEMSSFQLQELKYSPNIAVILNIFPDHLDSHKNFKEYINAKAGIVKNQIIGDKIFYFNNEPGLKPIIAKSRAKKIPVKFTKSHFVNLKINGIHNIKNALMAAEVCRFLKIKENIIKKTIEGFKGLEHRLELIKSIKIPVKKHSDILKNVRMFFYNDSASTNPQTTAAAIKAFKEPKILIAGGKDKKLDFKPLANTLKNSNTLEIILFGENKNKIKKAISKTGVPIILTKDLKGAVNLTYKKANKLKTSAEGGSASGGKNYKLKTKLIILFSPGSASFDMFTDYKERGKVFKKLTKTLR
ncbi:MAG: UDP-N-acetylmuramoyl-L-alanine--D-glutamate ligase [Candidatus Brennerbacteria bacterium]|nr:UDP-N-acetylmuramoyl-L-alanine--D-glutamate ligase [Candidatus Brennerbacteria bacterium]